MSGRWLLLLLAAICLTGSLNAGKKFKDTNSKVKKVSKRRIGDIVEDLESNVTALWGRVEQLSTPVHVHVHGDGHVMGEHRLHTGDGHDSHRDNASGVADHPPHGGHDAGHHEHDAHHHKHPGPRKHVAVPLNDDDDDDDDDDKQRGPKKTGSWKKDRLPSEEDDKQDGAGSDDFHHGPKGTHVHIHLHTGHAEHPDEGHGHHQAQHRVLPKEYRYARCDVIGNSALPAAEREPITGSIFFRQMPRSPLDVQLGVQGFSLDHSKEADHRHLRAMHGHDFGDLSEGCTHMGGHFNPWAVDHGGPDSQHRHPGDFGNLVLEEDGTSKAAFSDSKGGSLFGDDSLLGRGIVIHGGADDHGLGGDAGSKASGNAGKRVACCVIVSTGKPPGVWDK